MSESCFTLEDLFYSRSGDSLKKLTLKEDIFYLSNCIFDSNLRYELINFSDVSRTKLYIVDSVFIGKKVMFSASSIYLKNTKFVDCALYFQGVTNFTYTSDDTRHTDVKIMNCEISTDSEIWIFDCGEVDICNTLIYGKKKKVLYIDNARKVTIVNSVLFSFDLDTQLDVTNSNILLIVDTHSGIPSSKVNVVTKATNTVLILGSDSVISTKKNVTYF